MKYYGRRTKLLAKYLLPFILVISWIFSGWPPISSFAQEATSTPPDKTATSTFDENLLEEVSNLASESSQPTLPSQPPLKERKLNKEVRIDKNASHQCAAKNFTVDISNKNLATVELDLNSRRDSLENLEIGSLPDGIDITFLNNAGYEYRPQKSENTLVLQITNQSGSQRGNFSIPIIYQDGKSTIICQINLINF